MNTSGLIVIGVAILILGTCLVAAAVTCDVLVDYLIRPIRGKRGAKKKL